MSQVKDNEIIVKHYKIKNVTYPKLVVFLSITLVLLISLLFAPLLEKLINGSYYVLAKDGSEVNQNGLFVHYIDVGQGDATLIELPDKKSVLIDCGTYSSNKLVRYIKNTRCKDKIDYFILTHNHNDHYGQIKNIFENFEIGEIYCPNIYSTEIESVPGSILYYGVDNSDAFKQVVSLIKKEENEGSVVNIITQGDVIGGSANSYSIEFIYCRDNTLEVNDFSPIILLTYNGYKYIFSGDSTMENENAAASLYQDKIEDCHVLKVGHHGSNTSSSKLYLNALKARYAVISVLEGSYSSVPSCEVIKRLVDSGISYDNILRTDRDGTIISFSTLSGEMKVDSINNLKTTNNIVYIKWYYVVIIIFVVSTMIVFNKKIVVINLIK